MNEQAIREAAMAKLLHPILPIAWQLLEVNKVLLKERVPIVEGVLLREVEQTAEVYFPIEGERYYLVVSLDVVSCIALRWIETSLGNIVYF